MSIREPPILRGIRLILGACLIPLDEKRSLCFRFENENSLSFQSPPGLGRYIYFNFGLKGWAFQTGINYLELGAFGLGKLSLVPDYTFSTGNFGLGLKLKFYLGLASSPAMLGLGPFLVSTTPSKLTSKKGDRHVIQ